MSDFGEAVTRHREYTEARGLQPVLCRTRKRADGKSTPTPVTGATGRDAEWGIWIDPPSRKYNRLAFRPPVGAFVLDVDQKDGRDGVATLLDAEMDLGFLPPTQRLTSRGPEQLSGRLLFRAPDELIEHIERWMLAEYGDGIEIVRFGHRFSMAVGDLNPNSDGSAVVCYSADGVAVDMWHVDLWPELPDEWVAAIRSFSEDKRAEAALASVAKIVTGNDARGMVERVLGRVTEHEGPSPGQPYRSDLLSAAKTVGGFVAAGLFTEDEAEEMLTAAVEKVFNSPDAADLRLISDGLDYGYLEPFEIDDAIDFRDGWVPDDSVHVYDLFEQTPVLQKIRQAAHSRMVGASNLLVHVLGRVLAEIPPSVRLPPTIGSAASLNLGILSVAQSGGGKSTVRKVSAELMGERLADEQGQIERNIGSGEGLVQSFLQKDPETKINVLIERPHRIFKVDEMAALEGYRSRAGNTVMGAIRSALTGEGIGQENATADTTRNVVEGSYRFVLFGCVHPEKSDGLLSEDEVHQGTPQRFIWERALDQDIPTDPPEWPGELGWTLDFTDLPKYVEYPQHIADSIRKSAHRRATDENADPLEGHLNLTRLKVAAAFAFLHGETKIDDRWWGMAGVIISQSQNAQQHCVDQMMKRAQKESVERAKSKGRAAVTERVTEEIEAHRRKRLADKILVWAREAGEEGLAWGPGINAAVAPRDRPVVREVAEHLVAQGKLTHKSKAIGPRGGRPAERFYISE